MKKKFLKLLFYILFSKAEKDILLKALANRLDFLFDKNLIDGREAKMFYMNPPDDYKEVRTLHEKIYEI